MAADPRTDLADAGRRLFDRVGDAIRLYEQLPTDTRRAIEATYGKCTACGSVEVRLNRPHGTTAIEGESDHYPVGYGCEVCD